MATHAADDEVAEVVAKELALLRPDTRSHRVAVADLLHDAFLEFGASGRVWDRTGITETLAAHPGDVAAEAEDLRAVRLAEDVILLTYRARRPGGASLRSSLWIHDVSGWRLFFHQGTPCP